MRGSWSASQSGASSVGPSEHVGGKGAALSVANGSGAAPKRPPAVAYRGLGAGIVGCEVSGAALEQESDLQESDLGADAARARNRTLNRPRAALAVEGSERRWNL